MRGGGAGALGLSVALVLGACADDQGGEAFDPDTDGETEGVASSDGIDPPDPDGSTGDDDDEE